MGSHGLDGGQVRHGGTDDVGAGKRANQHAVAIHHRRLLDALFSQQAACLVQLGARFHRYSALRGDAHHVQVDELGDALHEVLVVGHAVQHQRGIQHSGIAAADVLHDVAVGNEAHHAFARINHRHAAGLVGSQDLRHLADGVGVVHKVGLAVHGQVNRDMVVGLGGQAQGIHRRRRLLRSALVAHHREHDNQDGNHDKRREHERNAVARHGALKHGHVGEQKRRSCRKGNQNGGAKRSAHLVQRVLQRVRMLDNAVVQRVQAPGIQRRHDGLHANAQAGVHEDDERYRRVQREAYQAAPTDGGNGGTGDDNAARPQLVEQAAGEIAHNGAHHGARQHDKASA